jgi:hypothetical protein
MAGEDMIMIRQGELRRLHVIQKVLEKVIKQVEAGEILSLSGRQIRRLVRRVRDEGDRGVIHKSRGKLSNRRIAHEIKDRVIRLYRAQYKGGLGRPWLQRSFWRGIGYRSVKRPYGGGLSRWGIGRRAAREGDIASGGSGNTMLGRWCRWTGPITLGLRTEVVPVF